MGSEVGDYLLHIAYYDGRSEKIRIQSHSLAMERISDLVPFMGEQVREMILTYLPTGDVVGLTAQLIHPAKKRAEA